MEILDKNPNPTKDQHFMVDKNMLQLIYDSADIKEGESIVEIGGGEGALTDYLANGNNHVTVIEKDPYYANYLKEKYKNYNNVTVIEGDALTLDYSEYDRVVANLPYTITEPFLANLAITGAFNHSASDPKSSAVKKVTLVISQNSLRKLVAPVQIEENGHRHANNEFGLMGTIAKALTDIEVVTAVPSSAFFPEPAVTSFVVNFTPKKEKTTVDRILTEFLTDKKNNHATIARIYQLLISQEKVYKTGKHKNRDVKSVNLKFTSEQILNKNIYDLSNLHYSQLIQDLVRNDMSIKSRQQTERIMQDLDQSKYMIGNRIDLNKYDESYEDDDYIDEEELREEILLKVNKKHLHKYDYLYESTRYNYLLNRGLEFEDPEVVNAILNCKTDASQIVRK